MADVKQFTERKLDRIIEMAWEDRTPFEAILFQFGLPEKEAALNKNLVDPRPTLRDRGILAN